jgi:hypothetical protein
MSADNEDFLSRWSRRKHEAAAAKPATAPGPAKPAAKPPELPPLESLTFDSDFKAFLNAQVDERVKRAALKKLFGDPRFNVMDGLDIYIDDYTKSDPIPDEMLERLEHARATFLGLAPQPETKVQDEPAPSPPVAGAASPDDVDPKQDA